MPYDIGDLIRCEAAFRDPAGGTLITPATVTFRALKPTGGTVTATPVEDSTGRYHANLSADEPGTWRYRWESTGTYQAAELGEFEVRDEWGDDG